VTEPTAAREQAIPRNRSHMLETKNDSFRFKVSTEASTRRRRDSAHALTQLLTDPNTS